MYVYCEYAGFHQYVIPQNEQYMHHSPDFPILQISDQVEAPERFGLEFSCFHFGLLLRKIFGSYTNREQISSYTPRGRCTKDCQIRNANPVSAVDLPPRSFRCVKLTRERTGETSETC